MGTWAGYQWAWSVPHDMDGLVSLYPSTDVYAAALDGFLNKSVGWFLGNAIPSPYYWAGTALVCALLCWGQAVMGPVPLSACLSSLHAGALAIDCRGVTGREGYLCARIGAAATE